MGKIADLFKKNLANAYTEPGMKLNASTMGDFTNYTRNLKEKKEVSEDEKEENTEATGSGSSGAYSGPLFSEFNSKSNSETPSLIKRGKSEKVETKEQRRKSFKKNIKRLKKATNSEGNTFKIGDEAKTYDTKKDIIIKGLTEKNNRVMAFYMDGVSGREIDIDGLDPVKEEVEKIEATEATGSGSSGGYETPAMWAKSTKKKDWGPSRKTQIPGGGFVKVKKKCTKFPYCNQGDINALSISKNESVKEAIKNVSNKLNISEIEIRKILQNEMNKVSKRTK